MQPSANTKRPQRESGLEQGRLARVEHAKLALQVHRAEHITHAAAIALVRICSRALGRYDTFADRWQPDPRPACSQPVG